MFSVVVTNYNYAKFLDQCLESIFKQKNCSPYEIVFVDDGSTDDSLDIARSYKNRMKIINQKNKGPLGSYLAAIKETKGQWIACIDSDDIIEPNYLGEFEKKARQDVSLIFCKSHIINETGEKIIGSDPPFGSQFSKGLLKNAVLLSKTIVNPITRSAIVVKSKTARELLKFDNSQYHQASPDLLFLTYGYLSGRVVSINKELVRYRIHNNNLSGNLRKTNKYEKTSVVRKAITHSLRRKILCLYPKKNKISCEQNLEYYLYEIRHLFICGDNKLLEDHKIILIFKKYFFEAKKLNAVKFIRNMFKLLNDFIQLTVLKVKKATN